MHHRAVAKMEREAAKQADDRDKKAKAAEDAKWAGEGPSRAEMRHLEKMQKAQDQQQKREMKKIVKEDDSAIMSSVKLTKQAKSNLRELGEYKGGNAPDGTKKITQHELMKMKEKEEAERKAQFEADQRKKERILDQTDLLAIENTNRERRDEYEKDVERYGQGNVLRASNIDAALSLDLSGSQLIANDKGAQKKKNKRAYKDFEEKRLPELKLDYPELKLSQLKEKCFVEFQRLNPQ